MRPTRLASMLALAAAALHLAACTPHEHLAFPERPLEATPDQLAYDTDADGRVDFRVKPGDSGRLAALCYDDDGDGRDDRVFEMTDYDPAKIPHLIILFDSIPYQQVADRCASEHWFWFDPPQKVIPPFPTMSGVIFTRMLHAPPLPGMINESYDQSTRSRRSGIWGRTTGDRNPWELRVNYRLDYWENGLSFLEPRPWFQAELARARKAFDDSPYQVTVVYFASTAGMLSRYGAPGLEEVLDGLRRFCLSVLHDRRGAVSISVAADHGHNMIAGRRIDIHAILRDSGFKVGEHLGGPDDVVVELDGLVNYAGIYTRSPARVADSLSQRSEIELAMYMEGRRIIVRDSRGRAAIDFRSGAYRYTPLEADVLDYTPVVERLRAAGSLDDDGFAPDRAWFGATLDARWPDAPRRLWEAFHGMARSTPDVMVTTAPGCFVGLASMERFITMQSTHGGLNQVDSATFILTTTGRAPRPLRTEDLLPTIEPRWDPERIVR